MPQKDKIHLTTRKDWHGWFMFSRWKYRVQLCWRSDLDGFWLKQYADKLGKKDFMKDFTDILTLMEKDKQAPFTLYELENLWKTQLDIPYHQIHQS